ncbi:MAG: GGDEF domain-containing protein [Nitrospirae bacterium]|nr:GGDEF domain-containing protein [Nitrospirota bacterium]
MKDRVKAYLFFASITFVIIFAISEYLAQKVDEEVEIYDKHVGILFNAHEILYHITAIKEGIYSLEYGTSADAVPIKPHIDHVERGMEGLSREINFIFYAGKDDKSFREYANSAEALQKLYPQFISHVNGVIAAKDATVRRRKLDEAIEVGERMEFFMNEIDNRIDEEAATVTVFLSTVTSKMRWIRNVTGILSWLMIVALSIMHFYSCKSCSRLLPYLAAMKKGDYDYQPNLKETLCEKEIEATVRTLVEKVHEVQRSTSELSIVDSLTSAYNRRYFDIRIGEEMSRYTRHGTIYSLSIIDIDYFKKINDTLGHQTGDSVLKELVLVIKNCVRDTDIVARYGGEEFAIISPYTTKSGVLSLVERLREVVEGHHFAGLARPLTISIGVSDSAGKSTVEQIIKEADSSLYIAKNSGRNMCIIGGLSAQQSA